MLGLLAPGLCLAVEPSRHLFAEHPVLVHRTPEGAVLAEVIASPGLDVDVRTVDTRDGWVEIITLGGITLRGWVDAGAVGTRVRDTARLQTTAERDSVEIGWLSPGTLVVELDRLQDRVKVRVGGRGQRIVATGWADWSDLLPRGRRDVAPEQAAVPPSHLGVRADLTLVPDGRRIAELAPGAGVVPTGARHQDLVEVELNEGGLRVRGWVPRRSVSDGHPSPRTWLPAPVWSPVGEGVVTRRETWLVTSVSPDARPVARLSAATLLEVLAEEGEGEDAWVYVRSLEPFSIVGWTPRVVVEPVF